MSNQGWIKLHRKLLDNPTTTSGDSYLFQLWMHLLLSVNAKEKRFLFNGAEMVLKPGQGIFGLNQIVKDCTIYKDENTANFKRCKTIYYRRLKTLEMLGNVKLQPTNKFTVITITNWNIYQSGETPVKLQRNSSETPVLTNKNEKNVENVKKEIIQHTTIQGTELSVIENQKELTRPDTLTDHSVSHYVIELFRDLNPDVARLHKLKGEADAALTLYRNAVKGNLDQLERAIKAIPEIAGDTFAPKDIKSISKPSQLLTHWALYCAQARGRKEKITKLSVTRL